MRQNQSNRRLIIWRFIARYGLLSITLLVLTFSILSGAEVNNNDLDGIIKNIPNAFPWLILLLLLIIAWKYELIGGILIFSYGLFIIYYFNFSGDNFWWPSLILTSLISVFGMLFLVSWNISNTNK
ncbi:DUF7670 domain-containing protein [Winogradskyella jejuensis]|uniref:DUF7670 domain-containing protein n=1 Tax=Winogradskyella jejuensis TaxID=1089305 RepID=A0A1M5UW22_9FLAO|nr:hypothetical protein [Winogradskyella jejuensis]SHH67191.1 hypothetical protein SAMN05444148_2623 [Winogradskyella jejuensis]